MQDDQQNNSVPEVPTAQPVATQAVVNPEPLASQPQVQYQQPATVENSPQEAPVEKQKKEGGFLSFALTLIAAFILVQFINLFLFQSYKVFGSSMYPTLHDGDRLIISKISRSVSKVTNKPFVPKRADIIVFVDPLQPDLQLIKRVIGLPGERVVVNQGKITVYNAQNPNGFNPDDAEYGSVLPRTSGQTDVTVPKGHLFVSGDNREGSNSLDSRNELGTVPEANIIGTLEVRIFPFDGAKFF